MEKNINTKLSPIFIVGAERSGTTLLRLMINAHPNIAIPFESSFIPDFYSRLNEFGPLEVKENKAKLLDAIAENTYVKKGKLITERKEILSNSIENYADLVDAIFSSYAKRKGKRRWGDKTPGYVLNLDILWILFPNCLVIHLIRDGRDVAVSLRNLEWGSKHIPTVADDWRWKTVLGHKMGNVYGKNYLELRYENLILHPEETLRSVCRFIDEEYHESMMSYHLSAEQELPDVSIKYHKTSISKPNREKLYGWKKKMSLSDRIIFESLAGPTLKLFGYEIEGNPSNLFSKLKKFYYCLTRRRW